MKRIPVTRTALAAAAALVGLVLAADAAPGDGPGWTGITNPKDVINAREELMEEIEHVMQPIDTFEVEDLPDLNQLRLAANTVHVMLLAVPHLFPPTTNLYDPKAETPDQLAERALLEAVRGPTGDSADREGRREERGVELKSAEQQRGVELDVRSEPTAGLVLL